MKKGLTVLLAAALVLTAAVNSQAQPLRGQRGPGMSNRGMMNRPGIQGPMKKLGLLMHLQALKKELNITDQQLDQIKKLGEEFRAKAAQWREEGMKSREALRELFADRDNRDYDSIRKAMDQSAARRSEMIIQGMKHRDAVLNVLTPEQREKLQKLSESRPGRMGRFSGRMQGGRFSNRGFMARHFHIRHRDIR